METEKYEEINLLGVPINLLDLNDLLGIIENAIKEGRKLIIPNYNLNAIRLIHEDEYMRRFYRQASYRHIDGMPIVFLGRLLGLPIEKKHRVTYIDFAPQIFKLAKKKKYKVFFLGSEPGVGDKAKKILKKRYPGLELETHHGYFNAQKNHIENKNVIKTLKNFRPDILIVGMGMPRQEKWILANKEDIPANVILTGGAVMDYITGKVPTPPRIMGDYGFEWLYRLLSEPIRLWKRYIIEPWALLPIYLRDIYCHLFGKEKINILED